MVVPFNDLSVQQVPLEETLSRVIRSGWYLMGKELQAFEKAFADYCGADFAFGVGNGTDALEIALRAVGISPEKKVLTVANAGGYATTAILQCGAIPHYVDVDPISMNMSVDQIEEVDAIVVTHLYGQLADIKAIKEKAQGIPIIEDCAQAHGLPGAGLLGTTSTYSFYPTKNLGACGDGGAVTTSDPEIAKKIVLLRQYGWSARNDVALAHGRNSRMDEIQAAILTEKLKVLDQFNQQRKEIATIYAERLGLALPKNSIFHLFVIRSPERERLISHLKEQGIGCQVHYPIPDHLQRGWRGLVGSYSLPITEQLSKEVLSLPCYPGMPREHIDQVCVAIDNVSNLLLMF